jgi:probable rRNA maturation factor
MEPNIILKRPVVGLNERTLATFVVWACRSAGLKGTVTVMVTGSREMRSLNLRFSGKSRATDVLSFPAPAFVHGFAGDIAISLDIAARNADALGHSVAEEVRILVLHGVLHLAGYDHENDQGAMAKKEQSLRKRLALPTGLIERTCATDGRLKRVASRVRPKQSRA